MASAFEDSRFDAAGSIRDFIGGDPFEGLSRQFLCIAGHASRQQHRRGTGRTLAVPQDLGEKGPQDNRRGKNLIVPQAEQRTT